MSSLFSNPSKSRQYLLASGDVLGVAVGAFGVSALVTAAGSPWQKLGFSLALATTTACVLYLLDEYRLVGPESALRSAVSVFVALLCSSLVLAALGFLVGGGRYREDIGVLLVIDRQALVLQYPISVAWLLLWRTQLARSVEAILPTLSLLFLHVPPELQRALIEALDQRGVVAQIEDGGDGSMCARPSDGVGSASRQRVLIVGPEAFARPDVRVVLRDACRQGYAIEGFVAFFSALTGRTPSACVTAGEFFAPRGATLNARPLYKRMKRIVDIVGASGLLLVAAPLMALIAVAVKVTSPGPVIYRQTRVGWMRRPVTVLKFRTMVADAERETGPTWAATEDDRVTPLGRFLRRFGLDELPQLINVLSGEMSLVGFRPIREVFELEAEQSVPFYGLRYFFKPGVTGWAQVKQRDARRIGGPIERFEYDMYYMQNASLFLDLIILVKTLQRVVKGLR